MKISTGNQGALRRRNLSVVLESLYRHAPISRIELARLTGLNKATVTNLINELIKNRYVRETGEGTDKRAGRREVLLGIDPNRGCMISVEIGVGFISAICTDFTARVIWRQRDKINELSPKTVLTLVIKLVKKAQKIGEMECGPLQGIAVGIPGLIDQKSGTLLFAPNLEWKNVAIVASLLKHFDTPIFLENEANFAALGEKYFGVAREFENVLYISAGVGIGGGVIIDGKVHNGAAGYAGEFGHITMDASGMLCKCGNTGCWETQASQAALVREIERALAKKSRKSLMREFLAADDNKMSLQNIFEASQRGDVVAIESLKTIGRFLGVGIDSLIKAFNPAVVVFGGRLSLAADIILPEIRAELGKRGMIEEINQVNVVAAEFGSDAAVMGGVAKVFQEALANPLL
jgi:glucokinase-like ROK family protein